MVYQKQTFFIVLILCSVHSHGSYSTVASLENKGNTCVPVEIKQCRRWYDLKHPMDMYYSTTNEYKNVRILIEKLSTVSGHLKSCAVDGVFMLCALYSPVCFKGSGVLKPCKETCLKWKHKCSKLEIFKYVAFPQELADCDSLPEHYNSMCIRPDSFITREQERRNNKQSGDAKYKQMCHCKNLKVPSAARYRHFRKAYYAFEATLTSRERLANGNTKILVNVTKVFKEGKISIKPGKLRMWSSCYCFHQLDYGGKYFFLLNESSKERKVEINEKSLILSSADYDNKIKKWNEKCYKRKKCFSNYSSNNLNDGF